MQFLIVIYEFMLLTAWLCCNNIDSVTLSDVMVVKQQYTCVHSFAKNGKIKCYFIRENAYHKFFWVTIAGGRCATMWNCYSAEVLLSFA